MTEQLDDLTKSVEGWLEKQGYPLEMDVARVFAEHGFGVRQGWYFNDPEEDKPREIDIIAHVKSISGHPLVLQFVTECKWSRQPFIVFTYPSQRPIELDPALFITNSAGKRFIEKLTESGVTRKLPIFNPVGPLGYDMKQANLSMKKPSDSTDQPNKVKDRDDAFDALMKVSKATYSMVQTYERTRETMKKPGSDTSHVIAYIALPLIVVDGPLFQCYLDERNSPRVNYANRAHINWSYPLLGNIPITVCTKQVLSDIISGAAETRLKIDSENIKLV